MARPSKAARLVARALAGSALVLAVFASPAAASFITPETPSSPNADAINLAYLVMLAIGLVLIAAVVGAVLTATVRFRAHRGREPARTRSGRGVQRKVAAALGVLALALFVLGVVVTEQARDVEASGPDGLQASLARTAQTEAVPPESDTAPLEINVIGQQWLWRFEYPGGRPGQRTFTYEELVVPVDTAVVLNLTSTDVVHRWWVPSLGGKVDVIPGQRTQTWFKAEEEGTYEGQSAQYSGAGYPTMRAEVEVVSAQEYEQRISELERDLAAAQRAIQTAQERQSALETGRRGPTEAPGETGGPETPGGDE